MLTNIVIRWRIHQIPVHFPKSNTNESLIVTNSYSQRWKAQEGENKLQKSAVWDTFLGIKFPGGINKVKLQYL